MLNPLHGEVWKVRFQPDSCNSEIDALSAQDSKNYRPALVISVSIEDLAKNMDKSQTDDPIRQRIVVPITDWKSVHEQLPWFITINQDTKNGLTKKSSANIMQMRSCDLSRFERQKLGSLKKEQIYEIIGKISICIGSEFV